MLVLGGCTAAPPEGQDSFARRAALLRGAVEAQWAAVRTAHDRGERLDSRYVYAIAELRTGAIRAELEAAMGHGGGRDEAETWIAQAEKALPGLLAAPLTAEGTAAAWTSDVKTR